MNKSLDKIQSLLPLGYLYLIILGIIKESLYYFQLDINILKYSSIMDILISPVADLTSQPVILFSVVFLLILSVILQYVSGKNSDKKWVQKLTGAKTSGNILSKEEVSNAISQTFLLFFIAGLSSFFFSTGIGDGSSLVKRINANTLEYDHKISFDSDKVEEVHLFDNNSSYYFYLSKGNKNIKIAPVGSVKSIEMISSKKLK